MPLPLNIDPDAPVPEPKDASTVMLLRDGAEGIEVFLVRRVAGMAFAGGMTVFPGGGVDQSDSDAAPAWAGPDAQWWAGRLGVDEARARRLVCAAARETFEECGVLLAGERPGTAVVDTAPYAGARPELEGHRYGFAEFLTREGLTFDTELLRPWSHWITPIGEKRRYDTYFFVAALPDGQQADGQTSEAAEVLWSTPAAAIDHWRAGGSMLLPPTWSQLDTLAQFDSVAAVMAAEPEITTVQPDLVRTDSGWRVDFDGGERYLEAMPR
ncbi:NUDIX hydrolase [Tomitella fengzijianii]|uniref:NUDIX hydrolase n=1 Tax=Tomitella fengzijianii TaxID=2597660 RepID=A0A516X3W7_9ACTN|nr:NUDIX hydrolase [Tomitella fengzijianii]QDQ97766.1 NUDIX hydrolase [Tomitella fengzijianii]